MARNDHVMGENALAGWPTLWALGHARTSWPLEYRPFGTSRVGGLTSFLLRTLSHRYVAHGCKLMGSKTELASLQRVPILSTCRLCENTFPTYLLSRATFTGFLNNSWTVGKTLKILRVHSPPCATFSLEWVLERRDSTRIQRPGNSFCLITTMVHVAPLCNLKHCWEVQLLLGKAQAITQPKSSSNCLDPSLASLY